MRLPWKFLGFILNSIEKVKPVFLCFLFDSGKTYINESKKTRFSFFYWVETYICLISWSIVIKLTFINAAGKINATDFSKMLKIAFWVQYVMLWVQFLLFEVGLVGYDINSHFEFHWKMSKFG